MNSAYEVCSRLKYLDYVDSEKEITIEINSPGGEVISGMTIIDTINYIKAPVRVVVCGMAASMAAVILASIEKGRRYILPHSQVMIHQPLGGTQGQASEIVKYAQNILKTKKLVNEILAKGTGKTVEEIERDTDRDYYMDAEEAIAYGIVDQIITTRKVGINE